MRVDNGIGDKTLFSGEYPGEYSTIVINNAPGYQLEYSSIKSVEPGFQFNRSEDCTQYLQSINDGLYVCTALKGLRLYLGKIITPQKLPRYSSSSNQV